MKIIHISSKFRPAIDGLSNYVYNLTTRLARKYKVTVITTDIIKIINIAKAVKSNVTIENLNKVRVIRIKTKPPYISYFWSYNIIPRLIKYESYEADILHIHSYMQLHSDISTVIAKSIGRPFVITIHAYGYNNTNKYLKTLSKIYHSSIAKYILSKADKIIVLDPLAKKFFLNIVDPEKIVIIPNGIEYSKFSINMREYDKSHLREKIGVRRNILLFTGILVKRKGINTLVKAMPYILREYPQTHLLIAGTGPEKQNILFLARKLGIQRNIKLLGFVPDRILPYIYQISDIFVLPSYHEGLPTVILEALASGLPIVATNVGGVSYIIRRYNVGVLVKPDDPLALAEAIMELLDDYKRRKEISMRSRIMARRYDWDNIARMIENVYLEVLSESK